jgi:hypothetical protein
LSSGCGDSPSEQRESRSAQEPHAQEHSDNERSPASAARELRELGYASWDEEEESSAQSGVVHHDRDRVDPGVRLWADDRSTIHATAPDGQELSTLEVPNHTQVEFARPLEGGRVLALSVDQGITLLESSGAVVWQIDAACHHEITLAPRAGDSPGRRLFAVALHAARPFRGRSVRFDEVAFLEEATGEFTRDPAWPSWSSWDHREALDRAAGDAPHPLSVRPAKGPDVGSSGQARIYDYFHLNGIAFTKGPFTAVPLGGGQIEGAPERSGPQMVVCLRNVSLIAAVELVSHQLAWCVGPETLDWPHAPSIVDGPKGQPRLLAFDNGTHRGWSRIIEIDPISGTVEWDWRGTEDRPLWSRVRGFAQRLSNGNTLVTESERGRVLEVTRAGEIVWEFLNPDTRAAQNGQQRRRIYRMASPSRPRGPR